MLPIAAFAVFAANSNTVSATLVSMAFALSAAAAYGVGAVFQGVGAKNTKHDTDGARGMIAILRHPYSLAGLLLDLVAWILSRLSLHNLPLFTVQTVLAGSLAVTVVLSHRLLHTPKRHSDVYAIAATGVGLILVGAAAESHLADPPTLAFKVVLWATLPILSLAGLLCIERKVSPPVLGALGGTAFGFSALAARAIVDVDGLIDLLRHPLLYVMLMYAGLGVVFFTRGLERGQVGSVTAAMWAAEIIPASIIGFLMLGDSVRPGWQIPAAIGIAITLGATITLAKPIEIP